MFYQNVNQDSLVICAILFVLLVPLVKIAEVCVIGPVLQKSVTQSTDVQMLSRLRIKVQYTLDEYVFV